MVTERRSTLPMPSGAAASGDQEEPFQWQVPAPPTAQTSFEDRAATPSRAVAPQSFATCAQAEPFQCSVRATTPPG